MAELELCCECNSPTGRAGRGEDSIYYLDGLGPFCEDCHDRLGADVIDNLGLATLRAQLEEAQQDARDWRENCEKACDKGIDLQREVERLKARDRKWLG